MITCPSCTHQNEVGSAFCENCGHDLREMVPAARAPSMPQAGGGSACPSCGFVNISGAAFCENCGTPLGQELPSAPPIKTTAAPPDPSPTPISSGLHCSSCGHLNVPGSMFCENCGNQMEQAAPLAPPEPVPPISVPPVETPPVAGELCPQCGHENIPGTTFCDSCGMQCPTARGVLSNHPGDWQVSRPIIWCQYSNFAWKIRSFHRARRSG
jgi:uncharacterized OB-fold protein